MTNENKRTLWQIAPFLLAVSGWIIQPILNDEKEKLQMFINAVPYICFIAGVGWFLFLRLRYRFEDEVKRIEGLLNEKATKQELKEQVEHSDSFEKITNESIIKIGKEISDLKVKPHISQQR